MVGLAHLKFIFIIFYFEIIFILNAKQLNNRLHLCRNATVALAIHIWVSNIYKQRAKVERCRVCNQKI